ncbi:tricorn protease-like protein [Actinocrispum wychmicini]|uniref:Tricorn protease-like protein n=1 Tax=Actinocrispum wychmicini TaxID=1213861 RepID=A0A4R2J0K1_9PSEU|nr:tricorn protease-like protein [Actinocrispum wychmicini]
MLVAALSMGLFGGVASAAPGVSSDGVWRMDGYGTVLSIVGDTMSVYQTTKISCLHYQDLTRQRTEPNGDLRFVHSGTTSPEGKVKIQTFSPRGRDRARLQPDGLVGDRGLVRVPALPPGCGQPVPSDRLSTFDVFWQTFPEQYPFFAAKGYDWQRARDIYRPQVKPDMSDDDFFQLLTQMIEPLHDAHTRIMAPGRNFVGFRPNTILPTPPYNQQIQDFIERRDIGGKLTRYANGIIGYADLPDKIGYLRIAAFAGFTDTEDPAEMATVLDNALDDILTPARTSGPGKLRGLVLDLRFNGGGLDSLGQRLASRLTDKPFFAYSKRARDCVDDPSRFTKPQDFTITPSAKSKYTGPIALLTSGSQGSAGETFTQAMTQRTPAPLRIGENTQGVFSDMLVRELPNGWIFALPNEEYLTATGRTYDGAGIPPHIRTPVFGAELAQGKDSAFDRALAEFRRQRS